VLITAQLIDGKSAHLLWAKSYERDLRNVLALENQIAQAIAQEIEVKLTSQERAQLASPRQVNPQAQEAYFKARYWFHKSDFKQYLDYAKQATEKDPNYAAAWAALGDSYGLMACCGGMLAKAKEVYSKWEEEAITTALKLDPNLAEAHASLGVLLQYQNWNWREAEGEYLRAIRLNPSFSDAHMWYSSVLAVNGRVDQAVSEARRAQQLNPYSDQTNEFVVRSLFFARQNDEVIVQAQKMINVNATHYWMGLAYEQKGNFERAISLLQLPADLKEHVGSADLAHAYTVSGRRREGLQELAKLTKMSMSKPESVHPFAFAIVYAGLGDNDQAFNWLEKACNVRPGSPFFAVDPRMEPLRSDPRYKKLLQRIGLPE
jgi:tetratricopeptide (TPR) repeat protein